MARNKISKQDTDFLISRFQQWGLWLNQPLEIAGFSSRSVLVDMIEYRTKVSRTIRKPGAPHYERDQFNSTTNIILTSLSPLQYLTAYMTWAWQHAAWSGEKREAPVKGDLWSLCGLSQTSYYRARNSVFRDFLQASSGFRGLPGLNRPNLRLNSV